MHKLRSIQVLRGIAATAVVVLHARYFNGTPIAHSVTRLGAAGVDLFFVISGFIMATIMKPSIRCFLLDRAWRIYPLWLIAVTPWIIWKHPTWRGMIASLTLWPVYRHFTPPALALGWSLSFELLFYASIALAMRTRPIVPLAIFAFSLLAGATTHWALFDYIGNPMIFEFLLGVVVAQLPQNESIGLPLLGISAIGFATAPLAMFSADVAVDASVSGWRAVFWGVPAAFAVYGCLCLEPHFRRRIFLPLALLGDASYSIYLFHQFVVGIVPWPVGIALSLLLGISAHFALERPILRLKPRFRQETATRMGGNGAEVTGNLT